MYVSGKPSYDHLVVTKHPLYSVPMERGSYSELLMSDCKVVWYREERVVFL